MDIRRGPLPHMEQDTFYLLYMIFSSTMFKRHKNKKAGHLLTNVDVYSFECMVRGTIIMDLLEL